MENKRLLHNSVTCLNCGETLVSRHRHDYKECSCEQSTICDGGDFYGRFGGKDLAKVQTNYIYEDTPFEIVREFVERGGRGINGDEELKYVVLKDINDEWLKALIVYEETYRPENRYLSFYKQEKEYREINNIAIN